VRRIDLGVGVALAALALAVFWAAQAFPTVPGQNLGSGFLPKLIAVGLFACAIGLIVRSFRMPADSGGPAPPHGSPAQLDTPAAAAPTEHYASAFVLVAAIVAYILLSDRLGFLIVAPACLLAAFLAFGVRWLPAIVWAIAATAAVHVAFYKLLRVPLPWGLIQPFY